MRVAVGAIVDKGEADEDIVVVVVAVEVVGVGAGVVVGTVVHENGPGKIKTKQVVETTIGREDMTRRWHELGQVRVLDRLLSFCFVFCAIRKMALA